MKLQVYCILFVLYLSTIHLFSQEVTGNLNGTIYDSNGDVISDVNISVSSKSLQGIKGAGSDKNGFFRILLLPAGTYTVNISHVAHQPVTIEDVLVRIGKTTTLQDIYLETGNLQSDAVVVTARKSVIDFNSAKIGTQIDAESLAPLPLDRNYRNIALLSPQTNKHHRSGEIEIAGSTGIENMYYIDGMNVTDPVNAFGGVNIPYNFIQEIEVKSGGYEAEFASALGGVINATTRSGSNEFQGHFYSFYTNKALSGKRHLYNIENNIEDYNNYDIGFGLGGPIFKDKLWFYGTYNPNIETEDVDLLQFGIKRDQKRTHLFAGKLTWKTTDNLKIIATLLGDPSDHDRVYSESSFIQQIENIDVILYRSESMNLNSSLQTNYFINKNLLLQGTVSYLSKKQKLYAATERGRSEVHFVDLENGLFSGGASGSYEENSSRFDAQIIATILLDKHEIKGGLSFEEISQYNDDQVDRIFKLNDSSYTAFYSSVSGKVFHRTPSLFIQDSWTLTSRLRLNIGLRWDSQYLYDRNGNLAQEIENEYQPRIGVIYQPGEKGNHKVFASYGRFYERFTTLSSTYLFQGFTDTYIDYDHNPLLDSGGGDTTNFIQPLQDKIDGLKGQYNDEYILGYERFLFNNYKVGIRGIFRYLGEVIEDAFNETKTGFILGNPGRGDLDFMPRLRREYRALEFTLEKFGSPVFNFMFSYVLSESKGNYTGLMNTDNYQTDPNVIGSNDVVESLINAYGLLPNNNTHVFKFYGSYLMAFGLNIGSSIFWQSGSPLNELGKTHFNRILFLQKRGTAGQTPALWDVNLRLTYHLNWLISNQYYPKLILDIMHIGSEKEGVEFDQWHYLGMDDDGNQIDENPNYGKGTVFQDPMMIRLGLQVDF